VRRRLPSDLALVLVSLAAIGALFLLAHALRPPLVGLAALPLHEGERVSVEARVVQASESAHGRRLVVADDAARVTALLGPGVAPAPGERVHLEGVVARFADGLGLSADALQVLAPSPALGVADLARHPQGFDGARVLVRGEPREGALVGGGARVALAGVPAPREGVWLADGDFAYDAPHAAFVLRVRAWSPSS